MILDERSRRNLEGVNPELCRVVSRTFELLQGTKYRIVITEGLRDMQRQKILLEQGKSSTTNSRHLTGHAVDFAIFLENELTWVFEHYTTVSETWKRAADECRVQITWGGDWKQWLDGKKDGTHIQLTWENYPLPGRPPKTIPTSKTVMAATFTSLIAAVTESLETLRRSTEAVEQTGVSGWVGVGMIVCVSLFVIYERVKKIRGEGL